MLFLLGLAAPIIRAVCQVSSDGETYWNSSIRCQENITRELRRILMASYILITLDDLPVVMKR